MAAIFQQLKGVQMYDEAGVVYGHVILDNIDPLPTFFCLEQAQRDLLEEVQDGMISGDEAGDLEEEMCRLGMEPSWKSFFNRLAAAARPETQMDGLRFGAVEYPSLPHGCPLANGRIYRHDAPVSGIALDLATGHDEICYLGKAGHCTSAQALVLMKEMVETELASTPKELMERYNALDPAIKAPIEEALRAREEAEALAILHIIVFR